MTPFEQEAQKLRQGEIRRLSDATVPRLEALRSLTLSALQDIVSLMLDRLGHDVIGASPHIVSSTKDDQKIVTFCADPNDRMPTRMPSLRRLHDQMVASGAQRGIFITTREFSEEAKLYRGPIRLVDGPALVKALDKSREGIKLSETYRAMCCQCGDTIRFGLDDTAAKPCAADHRVAPTITRAMIVPPQVAAIADGERPRRARAPSIRPPAPRPPGGAPRVYATGKAARKAHRRKHERRRREIAIAASGSD